MLTTQIPSRARLGLAETDTPTFAGIRIGTFVIRLSVQADVTASESAKVGNLLIYQDTDLTKVEYEVA